MARDPMSAFEIPTEMRKMAEQSVEQARKAFDGFISAANTAVSDLEGRASVASAGAKDVGAKAMSFAQRNIAASFEFAQQLVRARDMEEIMRIQSDYVKAQMQALSDQAKELRDAAGKAASEAARPKS